MSVRLISGILALIATCGAMSAAAQGRIEINQDIALQGGLADSVADTPGFPVRITQPGSYVLTGPLDLTSEDLNTRAIEIQSDDVVLDLNGFTIEGPLSCGGVGAGLTCSGSGLGFGVLSFAQNVSVTNGTVRSFSFAGLQLGDDCRVERVRLEGNGIHGLLTGERALVQSVIAVGNGGASSSPTLSAGIRVEHGSVVLNSQAFENRNAGILEASVLGTPKGGVLVSGSRVADNGSAGILLTGPGALVSGSTARNNGFQGVNVDGGSLIVGSTAVGNGSVGLLLNATSGFSHNVSAGNAGGETLGGVGSANVCGGTSTCP